MTLTRLNREGHGADPQPQPRTNFSASNWKTGLYTRSIPKRCLCWGFGNRFRHTQNTLACWSHHESASSLRPSSASRTRRGVLCRSAWRTGGDADHTCGTCAAATLLCTPACAVPVSGERGPLSQGCALSSPGGSDGRGEESLAEVSLWGLRKARKARPGRPVGRGGGGSEADLLHSPHSRTAHLLQLRNPNATSGPRPCRGPTRLTPLSSPKKTLEH